MLHGILNIYKEKEYTSHDVVAKLRGIVGQKKIGHTGDVGFGCRRSASGLPWQGNQSMRSFDREG